MCSGFYNSTLLFFILLGTVSPLKTFYMPLYSTNVKEKATKCYLKTNEVLLDADGHAIT